MGYHYDKLSHNYSKEAFIRKKAKERMSKCRQKQLDTVHGRIGLRLREIRMQKNLYQADFEEIGISAHRMSEFECGEGLGLIRLIKILDFLKISFQEFFNHPFFEVSIKN